jgi:hypothetical protein
MMTGKMEKLNTRIATLSMDFSSLRDRRCPSGRPTH